VTLEEEWEALSATEQPEVPALASGVDLSLLADDAADCLSVLFMTGTLEPDQVGTLRACESELRAALPGLSGPAAVYFQRLAEIAGSAMLRVGRRGSGFAR
jgi:hypothetical protein